MFACEPRLLSKDCFMSRFVSILSRQRVEGLNVS
jgi:hypothetical protein